MHQKKLHRLRVTGVACIDNQGMTDSNQADRHEEMCYLDHDPKACALIRLYQSTDDVPADLHPDNKQG